MSVRRPSAGALRPARHDSAILIVGRSARQLAVAARAAGRPALVADLFGDDDTRAAAREFHRLAPGRGEWDVDPAALEALCRVLAARHGPLAIVWGSGFEAAPAVLASLAAAHRLLGCPPAQVAEAKDPFAFAGALRTLGITHPEVAAERPRRVAGWLVKRAAAAGGAHVQRADAPDARGDYWQRFVPGASMSATLLATADGVLLLGCCTHFRPQPAAGQPYRQGGAVYPGVLPEAARGVLARAAEALAGRYALRGLCGFDFVLDAGGGVQVLELNPRPTASVELLLEPAEAFAQHLAACEGRRVAPPPVRAGAAAHAVCYAPRPIDVPNSLDWPEWVADRPAAGSRVAAGAPLCTVSAHAREAAGARARLAARMAALWRMLDGQHGAHGRDPRGIPADRRVRGSTS